jgi:nucleotide-binding universal stress UspA family protein
MADLAVLCTDGSELSIAALSEGLGVIRPDVEPVVVSVLEASDTSLLTGTGMAGGTMSPEAFTRLEAERAAEAADVVGRAASALGLEGARTEVLSGQAGPAICTFAEGEGAAVIVVGTRGHGGLRRAVLGSVSDHVIRNASCPVVVCAPQDQRG